MRRFFQLLFLISPLLAFSPGRSAAVYFSPEDHLEQRLISQIEQERKSIHACVYTFTHTGIAKALISAKERGVEVEVIVDRASVKVRSPLKKMMEAGIPIYVWNAETPRKKTARRSLMHHKFCIFGSETVWTGSFNWTGEASRLHQENAVVLKDLGLASAFQQQFYTVKIRSCIPLASYLAAHPKKRVVYD